MVPLFQRTYSWSEKDWSALWNDIMETYEHDSISHHFLGSIVSKSLPSTPEGVSRFLLIDGQQRLSTLTLLLAALRDTAQALNPKQAKKIHELYLTNAYESGFDNYKLLPTQVDRSSYFEIIDSSKSVEFASNMWRAYQYFRDQMTKSTPDEQSLDLVKMEQVLLNGIEIVSITLGEDDNEYRIFESLNATGAPLNQSDLLRNYFFMRIPVTLHDDIYHRIWMPLQSSLQSKLDDFFRYELLSYGTFVREGDVYHEWRRILDKLSPEQLLTQLETLAIDGGLYLRTADPTHEPNAQIAEHLARLNRWGGQTMYPFILNVYRWFQSSELDADGFVTILQTIESFLVRRLFADIPTNTLNRLFVRLAHQIPSGIDYVTGTIRALSEPGRRWPRDEDFREAILKYPLYLDSRPEQRRLILETLETDFPHKEAPSLEGASIEHIMPQTITDEWKEELGSNAAEDHRQLLHVLGNLTLSAYNSELSNDPFESKRRRLAKSNFELNKQIATEEKWTREEIEKRGERLADHAIRLWPGPLIVTEVSGSADSSQATAIAEIWNEQTFFEAIDRRLGAPQAAAARTIMEWAIERGLEIGWGKGTIDGSFTPIWDPNQSRYTVISVWTYGSIEIQFQHMLKWKPFLEERNRFHMIDQLNEIEGVDIPRDAISRRPTFRIEVLVSGAAMEKFLLALDWAISAYEEANT
jgi:hypothetical protein